MKICNIISQDVYYENEYHLFNLFFPKSGPKLLHFFLEWHVVIVTISYMEYSIIYWKLLSLFKLWVILYSVCTNIM